MGCDDETLKSLLASAECAICGKKDCSLVVDHCHKTSMVRGILCSECNLGLGKFKDDVLLLEFARIYLLAFQENEEATNYMQGMKRKLTGSKTARDPNSRINLALKAWNC